MMMLGAARYRASGELARGGWGMVLEAEDLERQLDVAIKVLLPMLRDDAIAIARLEREGRVMKQLVHPNICRLYDQGHLDDGRPFLVMERLVGETLRARLKREPFGRIDVETAIEIGAQLLSALDAVHSRGIIHRDVKPANIFLIEDAWGRPSVKLLDFGVCTSTLSSEPSLTGSWCVIGTPAYMAPEIALGDRAFDERADLFCVGLILHEVLTGRRGVLPSSDLVHVAT